jgi:hypothetical protein
MWRGVALQGAKKVELVRTFAGAGNATEGPCFPALDKRQMGRNIGILLRHFPGQGVSAVSEHDFHMQLSCRYQQPDNSVTDLAIQNLAEGQWCDFNLDFGQPGFLIFVYAVLNCQHLYMRTNAAERGLSLDSARGSIEVQANADWVLQKLLVQFEVQLQAGTPSPKDVDFIIDRMQHCPVSINLRDIPDSQTRVDFVSASS